MMTATDQPVRPRVDRNAIEAPGVLRLELGGDARKVSGTRLRPGRADLP
jgi:hypothetical protein